MGTPVREVTSGSGSEAWPTDGGRVVGDLSKAPVSSELNLTRLSPPRFRGSGAAKIND